MEKREDKSDSELKVLASDIFDGKIFTNRHLPNDGLDNMEMVFMPIALGAFSKLTDEECNDIGLIYEYLDKASPRSVNGYPTFMSFHVLNVREFEKMSKYYIEYKDLKEQFLAQSNEPATTKPLSNEPGPAREETL